MKSNKQIVLDAVLEEYRLDFKNSYYIYVAGRLLYGSCKDSRQVLDLVEKHIGIRDLRLVMYNDSLDCTLCGLKNLENGYEVPDHMYDNEDLIRDIDRLVLKSTEVKYYYRSMLHFERCHESKQKDNSPVVSNKSKWMKWL